MNRRYFLSSTGVVLFAPVSGCLESSSADTPGSPSTESYETCSDRAAIHYATFPEELQNEIDAAIDGGYTPENGEIHLDDAVDFQTTYILYDYGEYYVGHIEDGTLYLEEETAPTGLDTSRNITVVVETDATAELKFDDEVIATVDSSESLHRKSVVWGEYELVVERENGGTENVPFHVRCDKFSITLTIEDEDVDVQQAVLEPTSCPWQG